MTMNFIGNNATVADFIAQRRNDVATVNALEQLKQNGRQRTNIRAVPSSSTDLIDGDKVGDFLYNSGYIYLIFTDESNVVKWGRIIIDATF